MSNWSKDVDLSLVTIENHNEGDLWLINGPQGYLEREHGEPAFETRVGALEALEEHLGFQIIMGHEFNDLDGDIGFWHTIERRQTPRPPPPTIPPTLDWQIEGLLLEGSPVVDTANSAQYGYRGMVLNRPGGLRVLWDPPQKHDDDADTFRYYITSMTMQSGLDLSLRAGRNRAVDWLCDRLGIRNMMPTSPVFGGMGDGVWQLLIFPNVTINFSAEEMENPSRAVSTFHVAELGSLGDQNQLPGLEGENQFEDGTFIMDALAIKAIVEWASQKDMAELVREALEMTL